VEKPRKNSPRLDEVWRRLKKNKVAVVSLVVIILLILVAIFGSCP
jgi:ABC-type antimicrobial peptide transport system permease subunit